ncbi:hypothetical protein Tco_0025254 [Tanacetum coccineum]
MTHFVTSSTLDSAISCVMQGAFCTQRKVSMVSFGRISLNRVLFSILLVVSGEEILNTYSSEAFLISPGGSFKLALFHRLGYAFTRDRSSSVKVPVAKFPIFTAGVPVRLLALAMAAVCASRAAVKSAVSCRMASKIGKFCSNAKASYPFDNASLKFDNIWGRVGGTKIRFLGGNSSSGTKKYRGSNSNDGSNTGDGVKIASEVVGSGDKIGIIVMKNIIVIVNSIITLNS